MGVALVAISATVAISVLLTSTQVDALRRFVDSQLQGANLSMSSSMDATARMVEAERKSADDRLRNQDSTNDGDVFFRGDVGVRGLFGGGPSRSQVWRITRKGDMTMPGDMDLGGVLQADEGSFRNLGIGTGATPDKKLVFSVDSKGRLAAKSMAGESMAVAKGKAHSTRISRRGFETKGPNGSYVRFQRSRRQGADALMVNAVIMASRLRALNGGTQYFLSRAVFRQALTVHKNTALKGRLDVARRASFGGKLRVKGATDLRGRLSVKGATDLSGKLAVAKDLSVGEGRFFIDGETGDLRTDGKASIDGDLNVGGGRFFVDALSGDFDSSGEMNVAGDGSIGGSLVVDSDISSAAADISGLMQSGSVTTGGIHGTGDLEIGSSKFTVDSGTGNALMAGVLTVGSGANIQGDLDTTGNARFGADVAVSGDATVDGSMTVSDDVTVTGGDVVVTAGRVKSVNGFNDPGDDFSVSSTGALKAASLQSAGDLTVANSSVFFVDSGTGFTNVGGDLAVAGGLGIGGDTSVEGDLGVSQDAHVIGDLAVDGALQVSTGTGQSSIASGASSDAVALPFAPSAVLVTPQEDFGATWWVETSGSGFTVFTSAEVSPDAKTYSYLALP